MTRRPPQEAPTFDEVIARARAGATQVAALLPSFCRAAGLAPAGAVTALGLAERSPRHSRLVRDARRALDRLVPATSPGSRPGSAFVHLSGLKA